jgi:asparagine synthase (glutamine-hydrolysing)
MGFGIPIAQWFRSSLKSKTQAMLLNNDARCLQFFRRESIATIVQEHMSGKSNQGYRLWNLLMLELWLREWN